MTFSELVLNQAHKSSDNFTRAKLSSSFPSLFRVVVKKKVGRFISTEQLKKTLNNFFICSQRNYCAEVKFLFIHRPQLWMGKPTANWMNWPNRSSLVARKWQHFSLHRFHSWIILLKLNKSFRSAKSAKSHFTAWTPELRWKETKLSETDDRGLCAHLHTEITAEFLGYFRIIRSNCWWRLFTEAIQIYSPSFCWCAAPYQIILNLFYSIIYIFSIFSYLPKKLAKRGQSV